MSRHDDSRLDGVAAAFRHLDVRAMLHGLGLDGGLIRPETPFVFHALAEAGDTTGIESNPGQVRVRESRWQTEHHPYGHPPAETARAILEQAVDRAVLDHSPALVRGAWLAFVLMSCHPFVDGNGRTARLLMLLLAAPETPQSVDFGLIEQLGHNRQGYVEALQAGQRVASTYDARLIDASPFVDFVYDASAAGARLDAQRAATITRIAEDLALAFDDDVEAAAAVVAIMLNSPISADEMPRSDPAEEPDRALLERLVSVGAAQRVPGARSRSRADTRPCVRYALSPATESVVAKALRS